MLTWNDIEKMTEAELAAANKKMAARLVGTVVLFMALKWGVIIGLRIVSKKLLKEAS